MKINHIVSAILFCLIYSITACTASNSEGNGSKKNDLAKFTVSKFNNNAMIKGASVFATVSVTNGTVITTPIHINITSSDDKKIKLDDKSIICELKTTKDTCIISATGQDLGNANIIFKSDAMTYTSELLSVTNPNVLSPTQFLVDAASSCLLSKNKVYCWGRNDLGSLGNGFRENKLVSTLPTNPIAEVSADKIQATSGVIIALSEDRIYAWGGEPMQNGAQFKQDNNMIDTANINTPTKFDIPGGIVDVAVTGTSNRIGFCVIKKIDNKVYCWGINSQAQTGIAVDSGQEQYYDQTHYRGIHKIDNDNEFYKLSNSSGSNSAGAFCGITKDQNHLYCWGDNTYNIIDATDNKYLTPKEVSIPGSGKITTVAVGHRHACVLRENGNLYCWGSNTNGETGTGLADTTVKNPTAVANDIKFASVATENLSTCAISTEGKLYCWGVYGPGLTTNKPNLINNIPGNPKIAFVHVYLISKTAGPSIIAITDKSETYAWGDNSQAQLGNGNTNYLATPTRVLN